MMRRLTLSSDDRGVAAVISTAAVMLLAASVHFHILCSVICLHGEGVMMDDICHGAAQTEAMPDGFAARLLTLLR